MDPFSDNAASDDRFVAAQCSNTTSRAHFKTISDPQVGYQTYRPNVLSSHSPQGKLCIDIEFSTNKCSKSGSRPFFLSIRLENQTNLPLAVPQFNAIKPESVAVSRGPEVFIRNVENKQVVSKYRLEVCSIPDLPRLIRTSETDICEEDFDHLLPGHSMNIATDFCDKTWIASDWCVDFMEKAVVGVKYKFEIVGSTWERGKTSLVRCAVWKEGPSVFEVVE